MNEPADDHAAASRITDAGAKDSPPIVSTKELFGSVREICIEHEGERYVLRITRRGKLILQK
jgi:hemin uptake protein HemP